MDEVGESLDTVDGDDREALAIASLQLGIATDVSLLQLERDLGANLLEDVACRLAQVAPAREVEADPMH